MNTIDKFWKKVNKTEFCWIWTGSLNTYGYGQFRINGPKILVHRLSYEMAKGIIPEGKEIDHLCRNRICVNPDHLEAVSSRINTLRGISSASVNAFKIQCNYGHFFTSENTYINREGGRVCRTCQLRWGRKHRERQAHKQAMFAKQAV